MPGFQTDAEVIVVAMEQAVNSNGVAMERSWGIFRDFRGVKRNLARDIG